jgi:hypothetical protein
VHIAWWTGKDGAAGVWYARSDDHGGSFASARPLGVAAFSRPAHVQLALGREGVVVAAWDDGTQDPSPVVMRVSRDGGDHWSGTVTVGGGGDRAAAFPVLAATEGGFTIAWSERSARAAQREAAEAPDMKAAGARMGLKRVGDADIVARRGAMR